ncbi:HAMP domain-containing histidine kinase [Rhizobium herbae]|uniref:histidine kinase n=1 Tax=Rhizobium herbae TaxID=508661 RepID=A0ABS7HAT9_9HYPH|nr:HAMP domain-containing sensor histidine kinase [Rhizobium herbae]MBW9064283.1 HAMP domain-containing histidine kinase [Rhizobium herbae]MCA1494041.1 HAMP domain-containing histidine kinase [Ensifer sp. NBAIM29]
MQRLFWKFFAIIWLTVAGSIAALFAVTTVFKIVPFSQEIQRGQETFALDVASQLLASDGKEAAIAFATEAAKAPEQVNLSFSRIEPPSGCSAEANGSARTVQSGDGCYRITVHPQATGLVTYTWTRLAPWLSALVAAAVAAYCLARYLIRPVAHLRSGLSALASGHFDIRISDRIDGRKDEVAELAHDFDTTAERLEQFHRTQQRLFHDVSHELRSPLSRLQAAIGVLQQNPAKLAITMDRMAREVERIDGLVGEILMLARLTDRSSDALEVQTLDIIDLLNDIVADAAFEAQARGIRVHYEGVQTFVAEVNGELIYRALENVIRNAVKYTTDSSEVLVRAGTEADTLYVLVADEGPGVPTSDLSKIFQPFSRGEEGVALGGYGLGLAITKKAVERHGGRVTAAIADTGGLAVKLEIPRSISGT